jgi:hypothetical protein
MRKLKLVLMGAVMAMAAVSASAGDFKTRQGSWEVGGSAGLTADPGLAALQGLVNYYITDEIAVGPLAQYEFGNYNFIFGFSGMVKFSGILADSTVVRPYGEVGVGFAEFKVHDVFNGDLKTTYLFPVGGGMEFKLADKLSLDANALLNISQKVYVGIFIGVNYIF